MGVKIAITEEGAACAESGELLSQIQTRLQERMVGCELRKIRR